MPMPNAPWWRTARRQWYATIRGKKMPLGIFDRDDEAGAWEALRKILGVKGTDGGSVGDRPATARVCDLVPKYVAEVVTQHAKVTQASYHSRLRWFCEHFGDRRPGEITAEEIERKARQSSGWNDNTRRHFLLVCQHFVRWATGRKDFFLRKPPPESRGDEAVIRPEQFDALLIHARGDFGPYLRFLWLTGCRPGEACSLTCDLVDWVNGTAVLRKHKTAHKGKRRVLYLSREALPLLETQRVKYGGCGHLFRRRANLPFSPINVADRFRRAAKLSGVPRTSYCFRHSYITRMLESGTSDSDVAALVGHSGTNVIHRCYSHLTANARRLRDVASRGDAAG